MEHPSFDELLAAGSERMPEGLAAHLDGCESCRRLAAAAQFDRGEVAPPPMAVARDCYDEWHEIATGGMGRTWRARDRRLGRMVAIKEVRPDAAHRDRAARRLEREARLTASLHHPAIVPVHEVGRWSSGEPFYSMQYI